ncbi:hypothetical protein [Ochrobactrum sp. CGA5]|uniref:relaxase/mobilization nuclease domain-containing protein n=1 Tax=Ochrobactrum sp. CGA5 TaxID=2583453 RepID=UPI001120C92D|nr:hypothetical protein [Ochrobactrum sp. CGA5]
MVPNVGQFDAEKGGGFSETVGYVLAPESAKTREAVTAGLIDPAILQHRAATAIGFNLDGLDPRDPAAVAAAMQDIADRADELKKAAGISTRGRKATTSPVWHCSFRDAEHAAALLTDAEMIDGIMAALKALDLPEGHQILIVKHVEPDRPDWPDWHVIVNKVSSIDGTRWNPMNDQIKLQAFCHDWDQSRGLTLCPDRAEKIERVRDWAAKEADPKKRDRTPPAKAPKPAKPNYRAEKALAIIERDNLPVTPAIAAAIDKQLESDRAAWRKIGRFAEKEIHNQAKREKAESWEKLKADREAIDNMHSGVSGKVRDFFPGLLRTAQWTAYKTRAAQQRDRLDAQTKARYRRFYANEKTLAGVARNVLSIITENRKRGIGGMTMRTYIRDPDARRAAFDHITQHDRAALKEKLKADRAKVQAATAKHNPAKAAKAQTWADHQQRIVQIEARTALAHEDLKALRDAEPKKQRKAWSQIVAMALHEKTRMDGAAIGGNETVKRDRAERVEQFKEAFREQSQDKGREIKGPTDGRR